MMRWYRRLFLAACKRFNVFPVPFDDLEALQQTLLQLNIFTLASGALNDGRELPTHAARAIRIHVQTLNAVLARCWLSPNRFIS